MIIIPMAEARDRDTHVEADQLPPNEVSEVVPELVELEVTVPHLKPAAR
jgi:hypothetical protein